MPKLGYVHLPGRFWRTGVQPELEAELAGLGCSNKAS